ncbi:MAG: hypothetical protein ISR39_09835 [Akkermansiaceae bacterium]|nr:hypothetical protein [Akkermansiaceae bacterium]
MPASDTLEFNCPNCQVSLLVPKSDAGISGPCPHCGAAITSPSPIPRPLRNIPTPAKPESHQSPPEKDSLPIAPQRRIPGPPRKPEDIPEDQNWSEDQEEQKKSSGCWPAILLLIFLAIVSYFILSFLHLVPDWRTIPSKLFPQAQKIEEVPSKPTKKTVPFPTPPAPKPISLTPPSNPDPRAAEPTPDPFEENSIANSPRTSLKHFLAAKTLDDRRSFMTSSSHSADELRQSILSGSFPESHPPQVESKLTFADSQNTESYYTISFRTPLAKDVNSLTVKVVTSPSNSTPKVDTAFFLDLLQAPVTKLNQNLSPEPLTFQTIIEASAYCFDDIPNSDSMAKLIFFRDMDAKANPLATAYLARNSLLFQKLKKHNTPGTRIPGTVTVKWNLTLDPSKPFLEIVDLQSPRLK